MSFMSTKQMAERLGLKRHQLVYLIDTGVIRDASLRISNRRAFSEEDYSEAKTKLKERAAVRLIKSHTMCVAQVK